MATPAPIRFTRGAPTNDMIPLDLLQTAATEALAAYGAPMVQYGPSWGFLPLREWIAARENFPVECILTGNGSMSVMTLLAGYLLRPGDVVLVENPSYDRAIKIFQRSGAMPVSVPLESDGVNIEALRRLAARHRPRLFYVVADSQNPAGTTTSEAKRRAIAELAAEYDFLILEDAAYRSLRYNGAPPPQIISLAPDRTFTMGSFSKILGPGVRTGWVQAPASQAKAVARYFEDSYISPNFFAQAAVTRLVSSPAFGPHLQKLVETYRQRRDMTLDALAEHLAPLGAHWVVPDGGFFIGVYLPRTATPVWEASLAEGLELVNGDSFFTVDEGTNFVRIPFASVQADELVEGVARLAAVLRKLL